jgi:short-subunit dehydrogenase
MNYPTTKQALITGASSGIGKATALAFAKAGINLALVSRGSENLAAVAAAAREVGVKAEAYPLDLSKIEQVQSSISAIAAQFGPVDILLD